MRIGIITVAFNEPDFIVPCIKQFAGFNFPHIVLISKKPWRGNYTMDHTWALAKAHNVYGDTFIDYWPNQAEQFNHGLEILQKNGVDWSLIVDADEFYTSVDIGRIVGEIKNINSDAVALRAGVMHVYWKTPGYAVVPRQLDAPVIAIRTDQRFTDKRAIEGETQMSMAELHHMSYVRTDEQMKKKIETFEHSHEFDTDKWFNEVWLPWTEKSVLLHPTVPPKFNNALKLNAPSEIRRLINWDS